MLVNEIYKALRAGKTVCYKSNRYRVHIDIFGELTIEDTQTSVWTTAILDDTLIGRPVDYYIYGTRNNPSNLTN